MSEERFAEVGRERVVTIIQELEKSEPGWIPMFYFTGSCASDHAEAKRLREEFGITETETPKPPRNGTYGQNPETGKWEPSIPLPYPYTFLPWLWRRLTGWRDEYGRKAQLYLPWE